MLSQHQCLSKILAPMKIKKHYYCLVDNNNKPDFRFIFTNRAAAEKKRQQIKNSTVGETLFVSKHKRDFFIDGIKRNFIDKTKPINIKKGCWTTLKTTKISLLDTVKPEIYFKEIIEKYQETITTPIAIKSKKIETAAISPTIQRTKTNQPMPVATKKSLTTNSQKEFSSTYFNQPSNNNQKKYPQKNISSELSQSKVFDANKSFSKKTSSLFNFKSFNNLRIPSDYSLLKTKLFTINFAIVLTLCFVTIFYTNTTSNKKISTALSKEQQRLVTSQATPSKEIAVLGAMDKKTTSFEKTIESKKPSDNIDTMVFNTLIEFEKIRSDQLEESIKKMVAGTPMEKMAPYIAKKDKIVAAFLVGISKKESNYGRRVPVLNGEDCFNYWGYRGIRKRMGSGGHTCFDSPEDAIETVGGRIERLVKSGVDTPEEMVLWKCGSNCNATGGWPAARKWIKDVNMYYTKMLDTANNDAQASEKIKVLDKTIKS